MAHEISTIDRSHGEAFFAGKPAWHGLGTVVPETVASGEAIQLAGLDWNVEQLPLYMGGAFGGEVPDRVANVRRAADGRPVYLGTVGKRYVPIQNRELFDFVDALVGEGAACYESAGALRNGARVWALARLPENLRIVDGDEVKPFLLFANGHDGRLAGRVFLTPVRVVCMNTLSFALQRGDAEGITIRHTGEISQKLEEARRVLGIVADRFGRVSETWRALADRSPSDGEVRDYLSELWPLPARPTKRQENRIERIHSEVEAGFRGERTAEGSWWSLYNGATGYVDHGYFEGRQRDDESRMERIVWGAGADQKRRALDLAVEMAGVA